MSIRLKLVLFFTVGICASVLYYIKFQENIRNIGLLNFIGIPTIIIIVICHGIAYLIRLLLVKRRFRSAGITLGSRLRAPEVSTADVILFAQVRTSYARIAGRFFVSAAGLAGAALWLLSKIRDIPNEAFEPYLMHYWTMLASFALAMIMLFFAIHFLLMSFLLEYKSKAKALLVTMVSFIIVFLSLVVF